LFKNKEGKVRSGWKITIVLAIALAGSILSSAILGGVAGALMVSSGDMIVRSITDITYTARGESILQIVNTVGMLLQEIMFIVTPIIAWKLVMKRKLTDMGFPAIKSHTSELVIGLVIGIVSISVVFALLVLTGQAHVESWTPRFAFSQLIYVFIYISVGFAEEIYTRGFVMSVLRQTKSKLVVVIVSSVLFALMHSANPGIGLLPYINLALFGVFTAYIYIRSGNIWMCIGYHITWNYFQGYVFGFKVSGTNSQGMLTTVFPKNSILNGGAFGPEGGLFVTIVILLGILFVKLYYKNSQFDFMAVDLKAVTPESLHDTAEDVDQQETAPENTAQ
jgi:hypothetical protein